MDKNELFCIPDVALFTGAFVVAVGDCVNGSATCKVFNFDATTWYTQGIPCDPKTSYIDYGATPVACTKFEVAGVVNSAKVISDLNFEPQTQC